jgi:L-alanine-DL-glutamate epimerase-like enolase superfamily enzyme
MKVTKVETVSSSTPIPLPEPWFEAWNAPDGKPLTSLNYSFYKVCTDEGIVGVGPASRCQDPSIVMGVDPFRVGEFWNMHMSGKHEGTSGKRAAGLEIALWDIIGKAVGKPVHKLLGSCRDKIMVYAATSRLMKKEEHAEQALALIEEGFKAAKLRLHRSDYLDDLAVVEAVREAVGDKLMILVDANQTSKSDAYNFWSRGTSLMMAEELDELGVYFLEEPLPRADIEGLAAIAASVDMLIAGGEHTPTVYDFREHVVKGAYDIIQPDVVMMGDMGITGLRHVSAMADYFDKLVIPHVSCTANCAPTLAATLQAMATVENCPMVEYPYDPPMLTIDNVQSFIKEPLLIDKDGFVKLPDKPGIGIEIDEEKISGKVVIS